MATKNNKGNGQTRPIPKDSPNPAPGVVFKQKDPNQTVHVPSVSEGGEIHSFGQGGNTSGSLHSMGTPPPSAPPPMGTNTAGNTDIPSPDFQLEPPGFINDETDTEAGKSGVLGVGPLTPPEGMAPQPVNHPAGPLSPGSLVPPFMPANPNIDLNPGFTPSAQPPFLDTPPPPKPPGLLEDIFVPKIPIPGDPVVPEGHKNDPPPDPSQPHKQPGSVTGIPPQKIIEF